MNKNRKRSVSKDLLLMALRGLGVFGVFGVTLYAYAAISYPVEPNDVTVVYLQTVGCADDEIPLADATSPTGWVCDDGVVLNLWSTDGTHVWRSSGNVGIGTATPGTALTVGDGVSVSSITVPNGGICLDNDGGCSAPTGGLRVGPGGIIGTDSSSSHVLILPSLGGKIGVGTSSPGAQFDIDVPDTFTGSLIEAGYDINATVTPGDFSVALGYGSSAAGNYAAALGYGTQASGNYSFSAGYQNVASGQYSTALGKDTSATLWATASGISTIASGMASTALGNGSEASGSASMAQGYQTLASGSHSTAIGRTTEASGSQAFASGNDTVASGYISSVFNSNNTASGSFSAAFGYQNEANNYATFAVGRDTVATGSRSFAAGVGTIAKDYGSFVVGRYNEDIGTPGGWNDGSHVFVIGNGIDASNRRNAMVVEVSGHVGIGTSEPEAPLHVGSDTLDVHSGTEVVVSDTSPQIEFNDTDHDDYFIHVNSDKFYILPDNGSGTGWSSARPFVIYNNNVGIGTASPSRLLHVRGPSVYPMIETTDAYQGLTFRKSGGGPSDDAFFERRLSGNEFGMWHMDSSGYLAFGTAAQERVRITSAGQLHIKTGPEGSATDGGLRITDASGGEEVWISGNEMDSNGKFHINYNVPHDLVLVNGGGRVGIGMNSPTYTVDISGGLRSQYSTTSSAYLSPNNFGVMGYGNTTGGYFQDNDSASYAYVGFGSYSVYGNAIIRASSWATSDERLKTNINKISGALDKVVGLDAVSYEWKDNEALPGVHLGFIAQDVADVVPEVVRVPDYSHCDLTEEEVNNSDVSLEEKCPDAYYSISYTELVPLLSEAIKELKAENDALRNVVCELEPGADICQ